MSCVVLAGFSCNGNSISNTLFVRSFAYFYEMKYSYIILIICSIIFVFPVLSHSNILQIVDF